MTRWLRFEDLKQRNIVKSRAQLRRMQELLGFPLGKMLTPNIRAWNEDAEVNPWLASRPTENVRPLQGSAKAKHERRQAKDALTSCQDNHKHHQNDDDGSQQPTA